jgi:ABC-2 type transport system ATP-binding protein
MIEVKNLTKYYGEKLAVNKLNFSLRDGEIVGLLGLNGSGKTTTIRMLTGFLVPSEGEVLVDGISNFQNPLEAKKKIGYLPESPPLYEDLTVWDYLEFVAKIKGVSKEDRGSQITQALDKTNLKEVQKELIGSLSLGYRKRVGIAQALLGNPKIVIMDEPISGLDPEQILEMRKLIASLSGQHTVLISSHILSELYKTCDRFLMIHQGNLKYDYSKQKLEQELVQFSSLLVSLGGKSKEEIISYLNQILESKIEIETVEQDGNTYHFSLRSENETILRNRILDTFRFNGLELYSLHKKEVTLEQIFLSNVRN